MTENRLKSETDNFGDTVTSQYSLGFFMALQFLMYWAGLFPSVLTAYWYFSTFPFSFNPLYLLLLIPLFFVMYGVALVSSLIATKIGIWIVQKRVATPKPGSYLYTMEEPQTRAFVLRGNIQAFGRWLYHFFPLRFLKTFWLRRMGVKIGKHVRLGKFFQDDDFIEVGDNTFLAKDTVISGHLIDHTHITLNKTVLGKNCILESFSGAVGSDIGDNSIFKSGTFSMKGTISRGNAIYQGTPMKKIGSYSDLSPDAIEDLKKQIKKIDKIALMQEKLAVIKVSGATLFLWKTLTVIGGGLIGLILPYLYSQIFLIFYSSANHLLNIVFLTLIPLIFLISLGVFIFGTSFMITLIRKYYDSKADIPEGVYDIEDPRAKYFKMKNCLQRFGLRLFHATSFKIGDTIALKAFTNSFIGENAKMDDAYIDPQFLKIGKNTQIAAGAEVHTFKIKDGKLYIKWVKIGSDVLIGSYAHINPGVEIEDGAIIAVGTWLEADKKYTHALWVGRPAREFPIKSISHSAKNQGRYVD